MSDNSATYILTPSQASNLEKLLDNKGFERTKIPYTDFSFKAKDLQISFYPKKNNLLIQGKGTREFILFTLEPEITKEAKLGYEDILSPEILEPHFGIDESGKGDFFGPLVIAGVYTNASSAPLLQKAGICDSKAVSTSDKIRKLARIIRSTPDIEYEVLCISPTRYNELYSEFKNLNTMLAWGHAKIIENLLIKRPDCPRALSDQFAHEYVLKRALRQKSLNITLEQRTKAESDIAVAAASILAREKFVDWMDKASEAGGIKLPLGASSLVIKAGKELLIKHGEEILPKVAKLHFKTTQKLFNSP